MPARKIPLNYRNITGYVATSKGGEYTYFESSLERDALILLEFDPEVKSYTTQYKRFYYHSDGKERHYTPDIYVNYHNGTKQFIEIKYRDDLWKDWKKLKPKFKAVIHALKSTPDTRFKILTEKEIRGTYLTNVIFLLPYRTKEYEDYQSLMIKKILSRFKTIMAKDLVSLCSSDFEEQAEFIHTLWCLVAQGSVQTDMHNPLTMNSYVWGK